MDEATMQKILNNSRTNNVNTESKIRQMLGLQEE